MTALSRWWRKVRLIYRFLLPIRFSMIALAAASFAFVLSDQGQDILRRLSEINPHDGRAHWGPIVAFVLFLNALAYQIWFWARQMLYVAAPTPGDGSPANGSPVPEGGEMRPWVIWLPRILGALLFVAVFYATYEVRCAYGEEIRNVNAELLGLIALSFLLFLVLVILRRRWLDRHDGDSVADPRSPRRLSRAARTMFFIFLAVEVGFFVIWSVNPTSARVFEPGALVLFTLALWVPFGSLLVYAGIRMRVPILTLLIVEAFAVSPLADRNHVIRVAQPAAARPDVGQALEAWYARVSPQYPAGTKIPIFIVATEGGGVRAAYWTATVLASLQDTTPLFRRNLFAISGVSGGSLGALVFDALLSDPPSPSGLHARAKATLGNDFLSPTLAALTQSDLVQRFLPLGFPDRERALELAWEAGYRDATGTNTFARGLLETHRSRPDLPAVFINGTMVETGDRIITSNYALRAAAPVSGRCSRPLFVFRNSYDGFELLGRDMPFSAAAGMSARFTYVSPAGRVRSNGKVIGHVVDGGYFENSGSVTAAELLLLISNMAECAGWNLEPVVILISYQNCSPKREACDAPGDPSKLTGTCAFQEYGPYPDSGEAGPNVPKAAERWANEVLSPLRGLLATRDARGQQAVGDIRSAAVLDGFAAGVLEFRLVQRSFSLPLGWVLSEQAQETIDAAVETPPNRWARDQIAARLGTSAAPDPLSVNAVRKLEKLENQE